MRRLRVWLDKHRKPQVQVQVTFTGGDDQLFWDYLKKSIRRGGGSAGVLR